MNTPPSPHDQPATSAPQPWQEPHGVPSSPMVSHVTNPQNTVKPNRIHILRVIWACVMIAALGVTFFASSPAKPENSLSWDFLTATANSTRDLNEGNAQGAPQQTVVAGWHTADLLEIQIRQASVLEEYAAYDAEISLRNGTLIALLGLTIAGDLVFRSLRARPKPSK